MENRIGLISIVVTDPSCTQQMNEVLHEYASWIVGRMGIPYHSRNIALISVAIDAPLEVVNGLTGKLGRITGLNAKAVFNKALQTSEGKEYTS